MRNALCLEVKNLVKYFPVTKGVILEKKIADIKAVDGVSFSIERGKTLGLVGESGCGKTTTARCVLQLTRPTTGEIYFEGVNLCQLDGKQLRHIRRKVQYISQDPYSSLNPRLTAGEITGEPLVVHGIAKGRESRERVKEMLATVGLEPAMADRYPHMFSGGQRQRIGIARALILNPTLVVCDEPVSALDVSTQAQIINLLMDLRERFNLTLLLIAHDLAVVRHISDWVAVMYLGRIVEIASWTEIYKNPLHPYTQALLSAAPIPDPIVEESRKRITLTGEVPSPVNRPAGCHFHPRCSLARKECNEEMPQLVDFGGHSVACHICSG